MPKICDSTFTVTGFGINSKCLHTVTLTQKPESNRAVKNVDVRRAKPIKDTISPPCDCLLTDGEVVKGRTDTYLNVIITAASSCLSCGHAGTDECKYYQPGQ